MRLAPVAIFILASLAGCAGHLADHVGPRAGIVAPQLLRYGLNLDQTRCVAARLSSGLTPRQLRLFARAAAAARQSYFDPAGPLGIRDLHWVANAMGDGGVARALASADDACGVSAALAFVRELAAREAAMRQAEAAASANAAAAAARPTTWLNLGAATSGQSIAVDASTIQEEGPRRSAWFRMTNPGSTGPSADAFLLHIDCSRRTINARRRERRGPDGAVLEGIDYPDNPLAVEGGTVMEIAWLSMCT